MSNPGVITLTEKRISDRKAFRVEDNLGESIHIHYNDIRIDLTIKELLELSDICDDTIYDLVRAKNFRLDDFDYEFLNKYSDILLDLIEVKKESIPLNEIRVLTTNSLKIPETVPLSKYNIIKTKKESFLPVIFNGNKILVYGSNYAKNCFNNNSEKCIDVLNLCFNNNSHSISKNPWVKFIFGWDKRRIKKVCYKIAKKLF